MIDEYTARLGERIALIEVSLGQLNNLLKKLLDDHNKLEQTFLELQK